MQRILRILQYHNCVYIYIEYISQALQMFPAHCIKSFPLQYSGDNIISYFLSIIYTSNVNYYMDHDRLVDLEIYVRR